MSAEETKGTKSSTFFSIRTPIVFSLHTSESNETIARSASQNAIRDSTSKMMPNTSNKDTFLTQEEDNSKHIIIVPPTEKDVLCGRGRTHFFHEGNQRFREIVGTRLQLYLTAPSRSQKSKIVKAIAEEVLEEGARFLKQIRGSRDWYEAGANTAREKVSFDF